MELNTSYYFPLNDVQNVIALLKLIDTDTLRIECGVIVQIVPKS